jgi:hypothetical protein
MAGGGMGVLLGMGDKLTSKTPVDDAAAADVYTEALNDGAQQLIDAVASGEKSAVADAFRAMHDACQREDSGE